MEGSGESCCHLLSHLWVPPAQEGRGSGSSGLRAWGSARTLPRLPQLTPIVPTCQQGCSDPPCPQDPNAPHPCPSSPCSPTGTTHPVNKLNEDPVKSEDPTEGHMLSEGNVGWTACPSESSRDTPTPLPQALPRKKPCAWMAAQPALGTDTSISPETLPGLGWDAGRGQDADGAVPSRSHSREKKQVQSIYPSAPCHEVWAHVWAWGFE